MADDAQGGAGTSKLAIEDIMDRLYEVPPAEFTRARDDAARELRGSGQREEAERVKALRKPTAAAGAVNRLVREHRGDVERFLRAAAVLREAQLSGKGDMASATGQEHEALERLVRVGGETVRQTLFAAAVDDDATRQLLEARLERPLEPRGFGTLLAYAPAPVKRGMATTAAETKRAPSKKQGPDDTAARSTLKSAKAAFSAAQVAERLARHNWEQTHRELEKARLAVEQAQRDLDHVRGS